MSQQQYALEKLQAVTERLERAMQATNRSDACVRLIGASKQKPAELIANYIKHGLVNLGENYLQEGLGKIESLASLNPTWHFIGHIQSNKTKLIANNFDWVHGVDRLKIAKRLATQNSTEGTLKILIQLNLDNEDTKGGVIASKAPEIANEIAQYYASQAGAELKGFMAIPKARQSHSEQRATFARARELLVLTNQQYGLELDELSMGMSGDLEAAVAEGSTMVRIGTDLFGARKSL